MGHAYVLDKTCEMVNRIPFILTEQQNNHFPHRCIALCALDEIWGRPKAICSVAFDELLAGGVLLLFSGSCILYAKKVNSTDLIKSIENGEYIHGIFVEK